MNHLDHALLCVYYPQQLLPGLAAVVEFRVDRGIDVQSPITILVWSDPGVGLEFLTQRQSAFEVLLMAFPWATLVFPTASEVKAHLSPNFRVRTKARYLRQRFGAASFGSIFYAHDIGSDYFAQSAMQAFAQAQRVCFGDALGVVYSNDYYTAQTYPLGSMREIIKTPLRSFVSFLWRCKRSFTLPAHRERLDADVAALILPSDPGGDFLPGKKLLEIHRSTLDFVLNGLAQGVEKSLAGHVDAHKHLMLLGSFFESGFTSEADEQALCLEVIRSHVPPGETVILKAHPASYGNKVRRLASAVGTHCQVEFTEIDALPIEALRSLAQCRSVISFSYSSVSLHYLYGSNVVHAMTAHRIDRYFPAHIRPWMHESNALYLEQLAVATRLRQEQLASQAPGTPING